MSNHINQFKFLINKSQPNIGDLILVESSRDNYVFIDNNNNQIIRVSVSKSKKDVESESRLLKYIYEKGFPVPQIINTGSIRLNKISYPYIIFELVKHRTFKKLDLKKVEEAGHLLSKLHKITKEYCSHNTYAQDRHLDDAIVRLYEELLINKNNTLNKKNLIEDLKWGIDFYNSQDFKKQHLVLHNDYRTNNVLFGKTGNIAAIIDFDWSLESPFPLKDVGHSALEWSFPEGGKLNMKYYERFVESYWKSNPTDEEISLSEVWQWSKFSAICDAAHYFLSFPERTINGFNSYMYDKYIYLKNNEL